MLSLQPAYLAVLKAHVGAETEHRMEETLATLTADCVFEDVPSGQVYHGHAGVRAYYAAWWAAFGNVPTGSRRYVPADDFMIVETRFTGSHRGAWEGVAPSGKAIDLPVAIFISFRDGLMSGERFYYDHATLLRQIGAP
jgi:steroid delta-isomerase-like uncharacterized protein